MKKNPEMDENFVKEALEEMYVSENSPKDESFMRSWRYLKRSYYKKEHKKLLYECCFVSQLKPRTMEGALQDDKCCVAMQEELNQFERNEF